MFTIIDKSMRDRNTIGLMVGTIEGKLVENDICDRLQFRLIRSPIR